MPCRTFDIGIPSHDLLKTIDRFYRVAFGPVPEFFQLASWCGWRPISEDQRPSALLAAIGAAQRPTQNQSPHIDVYETKEDLIVEVGLNGIKKESLYLEMTANGLIIRGEQDANEPPSPAGNITPKRFQRFVHLPEAALYRQVRAETNGDVVKINIRKRRK